jgi:hypothetical protein
MYASRSAYVSYEVTVRSDAMASRNSSTRCTGMSQVCMVCSSARPISSSVSPAFRSARIPSRQGEKPAVSAPSTISSAYRQKP